MYPRCFANNRTCDIGPICIHVFSLLYYVSMPCNESAIKYIFAFLVIVFVFAWLIFLVSEFDVKLFQISLTPQA